ncbi:MAG TPA: hypothetical protein VM782_01175 [Stellaceae bacterium]|nr:hypothetical protein [Stellaceae bacterium]
MFGNIFADADVGTPSFNAAAGGGVGAELGFGPVSSNGGGRHPLYPDDGFAWGFWLGVAGLAALVMIRRALPA